MQRPNGHSGWLPVLRACGFGLTELDRIELDRMEKEESSLKMTPIGYEVGLREYYRGEAGTYL